MPTNVRVGAAVSPRTRRCSLPPVTTSNTDTLLRADIRRLGNQLGDALTRQHGPELLELARSNLEKYQFANIKLQIAGETLGIPGQTFNKILVSAAAEELPSDLIHQLNAGGIMVIPVQNSMVVIYKRADDSVEQKEFPGFRFVPLIY